MKRNEKAVRIEPIVYELSELLDVINKAHEGLVNSLWLLVIGTGTFTFYLPYFLFMAVYLYRLHATLAVSIVLVFIPVAITQLVRGVVFAKLEMKLLPFAVSMSITSDVSVTGTISRKPGYLVPLVFSGDFTWMLWMHWKTRSGPRSGELVFWNWE